MSRDGVPLYPWACWSSSLEEPSTRYTIKKEEKNRDQNGPNPRWENESWVFISPLAHCVMNKQKRSRTVFCPSLRKYQSSTIALSRYPYQSVQTTGSLLVNQWFLLCCKSWHKYTPRSIDRNVKRRHLKVGSLEAVLLRRNYRKLLVECVCLRYSFWH